MLVASSLFALDPARKLGQYVHEVWGTDEELPQATVRAIVQTRDGYLWIGTEEGLARFDGVRFVVFDRHNQSAFRANHVLSLLEDRRGDLWIGTQSGGLIRHHAGRFKTYTNADGLPTNFIYALHEDREGSIWIGARGGLAILKDGRISPYHRALDGDTIWSIQQDRSSAIWVGTDLHGIAHFGSSGVRTFDTARGLPHDSIPVIRQLRDGRVIIGTNGAGLFEWNGAQFIPFRARGNLPGLSIHALLEDSSGNLWIGTNAGLARATNGVISVDAPGELGRSTIHALAEDAEGSLWIGTSGAGLHRLRDGKAYTMTTADGLPSDTVHTVFHDRSGATWIGTRDGIARIAGGEIATYSMQGLPDQNVRSLFQSSDGSIWIGTDLGGVMRIHNGRRDITIIDPRVPDNTIRAFAEEPGVGVWVGTNGSPLTLFPAGTNAPRLEGRGEDRLFVRAMATGKDGSLWVATDGNGLYQFVRGALKKRYREADGLSRNSLRSLSIDGAGTIWIGTDGGGLNRLQNGTITSYGTHDGLFDDVVLQILEDDAGRLWMSSNKGIFAVEKRLLQAFAEHKVPRIESFSIDDHDGMISRDCSGGSQPAGAKSGDGRLWFPTNAGVVVVDPKHMRHNRRPPPVHIEGVVAGDVAVAGVDAFELARGAKNVEISYTALSFVVPAQVRFRYKLEGYDEDWVDAGTRRTAYYSSLRPGRYRFRVIAANEDGVWNDVGASAAITLPSYFYQRRSFLVLVLLGIGAILWAAVALRIRRIRNEAARTAEMERGLVLAQRMDALGQMASGIAHDFNNTLMAAYPWAEMIKISYPHDRKLQRIAQNIINAVERAKKVTSQLLDFAQPKQPEIAPVDLGEVARKSVAIARVVMPPEIDLRIASESTDAVALADEGKIEQVLMNLLLNARDAMPSGGTLIIGARHPTEAEAAAWDIDRRKHVVLSVTDSGSGIDPTVSKRIFDPFYTTKGVGKGSGLGLAVVHRIVHDHNGAVHVESAVGKGTTFHVVLPRAAGTPARSAPAAAPATERRILEETQVLIIDDEAVIKEVLCDILALEGANVTTSSSGPEALASIDAGLRPDAVVLDLGLPEMSGDRVHALLRERFPDLPIIISTGYDDRERLDALLNDPNTSYLQKPYSVELLVRRIVSVTAARNVVAS